MTWTNKYKKSIDCNNPKGFSQKAHCQARKLRQAGKDTKSKPVEEAVKMSSLDRFRKAAADREKKHQELEKEMKARHAAGKEDMRGAIDKLAQKLHSESKMTDAEERGGADAYYGRKYNNPHTTGSQEHKDYHKGYHGTEHGQKDYGTPKGKLIHKISEDVPVNSVSGGKVAGIGVGTQGEPGVNLKKKKTVIPFKMFKRNKPVV